MISTGTEMERVEAIVSVLNSTYAGFNEVMAQTPTGKLQNFVNKIEDLKNKIGKSLQPVVDKLLKAWEDLEDFFSDPKDVVDKYS
jgi:hypothetical protein